MTRGTERLKGMPYAIDMILDIGMETTLPKQGTKMATTTSNPEAQG